MNSKLNKKLVAAAIAVAVPVASQAGLGPLKVKSSLDEEFSGVISVTGSEAKLLLQNPSAVAISQPGFDITAVRSRSNRIYLKIRSDQRITSPIVNFTVRVGNTEQSYSTLVDVARIGAPSTSTSKVVATRHVPQQQQVLLRQSNGKAVKIANEGVRDAYVPYSDRVEPNDRPVPQRKGSYVVKKHDTLTSIARRAQPEGTTLSQVKNAIFNLNRKAFLYGDRDMLVKGATLYIPNRDEVLQYSSTKASHSKVRHSRHVEAPRREARQEPSVNQREIKQVQEPTASTYNKVQQQNDVMALRTQALERLDAAKNVIQKTREEIQEANIYRRSKLSEMILKNVSVDDRHNAIKEDRTLQNAQNEALIAAQKELNKQYRETRRIRRSTDLNRAQSLENENASKLNDLISQLNQATEKRDNGALSQGFTPTEKVPYQPSQPPATQQLGGAQQSADAQKELAEAKAKEQADIEAAKKQTELEKQQAEIAKRAEETKEKLTQAEQKLAPQAEQKPAPQAEQKPAPQAEQKPAPQAEQKPAPQVQEPSKAEQVPNAPKTEIPAPSVGGQSQAQKDQDLVNQRVEEIPQQEQPANQTQEELKPQPAKPAPRPAPKPASAPAPVEEESLLTNPLVLGGGVAAIIILAGLGVALSRKKKKGGDDTPKEPKAPKAPMPSKEPKASKEPKEKRGFSFFKSKKDEKKDEVPSDVASQNLVPEAQSPVFQQPQGQVPPVMNQVAHEEVVPPTVSEPVPTEMLQSAETQGPVNTFIAPEASMFTAPEQPAPVQEEAPSFDFNFPEAPKAEEAPAFDFNVPEAPKAEEAPAFDFNVPEAPKAEEVPAFDFNVPEIPKAEEAPAFDFDVPETPKAEESTSFDFSPAQTDAVAGVAVAATNFDLDLNEPSSKPDDNVFDFDMGSDKSTQEEASVMDFALDSEPKQTQEAKSEPFAVDSLNIGTIQSQPSQQPDAFDMGLTSTADSSSHDTTLESNLSVDDLNAAFEDVAQSRRKKSVEDQLAESEKQQLGFDDSLQIDLSMLGGNSMFGSSSTDSLGIDAEEAKADDGDTGMDFNFDVAQTSSLAAQPETSQDISFDLGIGTGEKPQADSFDFSVPQEPATQSTTLQEEVVKSESKEQESLDFLDFSAPASKPEPEVKEEKPVEEVSSFDTFDFAPQKEAPKEESQPSLDFDNFDFSTDSTSTQAPSIEVPSFDTASTIAEPSVNVTSPRPSAEPAQDVDFDFSMPDVAVGATTAVTAAGVATSMSAPTSTVQPVAEEQAQHHSIFSNDPELNTGTFKADVNQIDFNVPLQIKLELADVYIERNETDSALEALYDVLDMAEPNSEIYNEAQRKIDSLMN